MERSEGEARRVASNGESKREGEERAGTVVNEREQQRASGDGSKQAGMAASERRRAFSDWRNDGASCDVCGCFFSGGGWLRKAYACVVCGTAAEAPICDITGTDRMHTAIEKSAFPPTDEH